MDESILPPTSTVGKVTWDIVKVVQEAHQRGPDPGTSDSLFVPISVKGQVLDLVHTSMLTCHPGLNHI